MTIDVGTGDGRSVVETAVRNPRTLVLGMDASAAAMVEVSRRAARPMAKGGLPNAAFVLAAAEAAPAEFAGRAALVTVRLPWGSLLLGCVGRDATVARGVASLVAPGGTLELLLAPAGRDGIDGVPTELDAIVEGVVEAFRGHGFELEVARSATEAEIIASGSTWAKRLRSQRTPDRTVMLVRLVRTL